MILRASIQSPDGERRPLEVVAATFEQGCDELDRLRPPGWREMHVIVDKSGPSARTLPGMVTQLPLRAFDGVPVREYKVTCAIAGTDQVADIEVAAAGEDMARDLARDAIRLDLDIPVEDVTVTALEDLGPGTL